MNQVPRSSPFLDGAHSSLSSLSNKCRRACEVPLVVCCWETTIHHGWASRSLLTYRYY